MGEVAGEEQYRVTLASNPTVFEFNPESVMVTGTGCAAGLKSTNMNRERIKSLPFNGSQVTLRPQ